MPLFGNGREKVGQCGVGPFLGMLGLKFRRQSGRGVQRVDGVHNLFRMEAKLWETSRLLATAEAVILQSLLLRGPVPQLCSKARPFPHYTVISSGRNHNTSSLISPTPPSPGSAFTGKGTHFAPDQAKSARHGTRCSYRHVGPCAHEGVGHGVDELSANPKVTELDLPTRVH